MSSEKTETFDCSKCDYQCGSKRVLAGHESAVHSDKVYECPHCPFVSRYQANFYRHRRIVHKIGRTTCNICNQDCVTVDGLVQHKELDHGQGLEEVLNRYEKDKHKRHQVETYDNYAEEERDKLKKAEALYFSGYGYEAVQHHYYSIKTGDNVELLEVNPEVDSDLAQPSTSRDMQRSPLKVKRHYTCKDCNLQTIDPREFLYHRKEVHFDRISVHECPYCIYATKHFQKLQRHCGLVHKNHPKPAAKTNEVSPYKVAQAANIATTARKSATAQKFQSRVVPPAVKVKSSPRRSSSSSGSKPVSPLIKCTRCDFQCKSRILMSQHEKTVHLRKRFFRCLQCGYVTNERGRYTKHVKYHSLPKVKCEECDFYTTYKWNLDRHMKSHEIEGPYKCPKCSFSANNRQSLSFHLAKHHDGGNENDDEEDEEAAAMMEEEDPEEVDVENVEEKEYEESNENSLEDFLGSDSHLTCRFCSFKTYSRSTLNQHEESHGNSKRYECPLCRVSFDHVAWLAKHLTQKHGKPTDTNDVSKPSRRNPPNIVSTSPKSMSSPPSSPPVLKMKVNKATKTFASTSNKNQSRSPAGPRAKKSLPKSDQISETPKEEVKLQHSCTVCAYKTRWQSEMEKHVRVHSLERPFGCPSCKYRCKWKGDLKRHVLKYHDESLVEEVEKMKTPIPDGSVGYTTRELDKPREEKESKVTQKAIIPARSILKPAKLRSLLTRDKSPEEKSRSRKSFDSDTEVSLKDESEGDLVIDESYGMYEPNVLYNSKKRDRSVEETPPQTKKQKTGDSSYFDKTQGNQNLTKKYKCTFCPFMSRTASRFHVHIVQHLNKKPFMCSTCFYRSNWEWDITKHIKIKSVRDEAHRHASMLVTDESGRKNYEKYNRFLVDAEDSEGSPEPAEEAPESPEQDPPPAEYPNYVISPEDVETIVVTPDLGGEDKEEQVESIELDLSRYFNSVAAPSPEKGEKSYSGQKLYFCRHCPFKNSEKKAVVGHLSLHAGTKPFQCRICGMVSNWKHVILRHVKMRHGGNLDDVKNRLNYIENDNVIELTGYPELVTFKPREPEKPKKSSTPVSSSTPKADHQFHCDMCPYTCDKLCYMHFHVKQHKQREGANFKCPHCDYWVNFKKTLNRHLKVHVEEKPPVEETPAYYEGSYEEPVEKAKKPPEPSLHPASKKFQCEFCPYTTDNKRHFLYHKQFHRPNKAAPFKCEFCSYWSLHNHLITQHTKKCHTENIYGTEERVPPAVEIFLPQKNVLTTSEVVDTSENEIVMVEQNGKKIRMIKCRYCPMMNRRRANVRSHEEMHSEVKHSRFPCPLCNYQCNSQGVLTSHIKLHTAEEQKQHDQQEEASPIDFDFLNQESYSPKSSPPVPPALPILLPKTPSWGSRRSNSFFCTSCPAMCKNRNDFQTHFSFHGSNHPFGCDRCDYRARHKPHLHKHLQVHTEEYMARRARLEPATISETPPKVVSPTRNKVEEESEDAGNTSAQMSSVNQMLLLEERETSMFLEKGFNKQTPKVNQCTSCPAAFQKPSVLSFHKYLHGVNGKFYCPHCDYSVNEIKNLKTHQKLHPVKAAPVRTVLKIFACNKCPAVFTKNNRYLKHIDLHGKENKFTCERCDFSVNLLIQLVKHRNVHKKMMDKETDLVPSTTPTVLPTTEEVVKDVTPVVEKLPEITKPEVKEKVTYCCNRCPYFHARRDAMINHHKRHTANAAIQCPHCDYSTLQASFLRDHIKWHFQPQKLIKANSFMKYSQLEVWSTQGNKRQLLFKDKGEDKENDRFFSPLVDDSDGEVVEVTSEKSASKPLEINLDSDSAKEDIDAAREKNKNIQVFITDVLNQSVRKRMSSSLTNKHSTKKRKTNASEALPRNPLLEDSNDSRLVIDQEYNRDEPPILTRENGYEPEEIEEEYEHREYVPDEPPVVNTNVQCLICPYKSDKDAMEVHKSHHKPRDGRKFKCPRCDFWTNDMKGMKRHLRLHEKSEESNGAREKGDEGKVQDRKSEEEDKKRKDEDKDKKTEEEDEDNKVEKVDNKVVEQDKKVEKEDKKVEEEDKKVEEEDQKVEEKDQKAEEKDQMVEEEDQMVEEEDQMVEEEDQMVEEDDKKVKEDDKKVKEDDKKVKEDDKKVKEDDKKVKEDDKKVKEDDKKVKEDDKKVKEDDKKVKEDDKKVKEDDKKVEEVDKKVEEVDKKVEEVDKKVEEEDKKVEEEDKKVEEEDKKVEEVDKKVEEEDKKVEEEGKKEQKKENKVKDKQVENKDKQVENKDKKVENKEKKVENKDKKVENKDKQVDKNVEIENKEVENEDRKLENEEKKAEENLEDEKKIVQTKGTEIRNAVDEQEVIDAVENMLQGTRDHEKYDDLVVDEIMEETEIHDEDMDETVDNDEIIDLSDMNKENEVVQNQDSEDDAEVIEVNGLDDRQEVDHTYAEFPESSKDDNYASVVKDDIPEIVSKSPERSSDERKRVTDDGSENTSTKLFTKEVPDVENSLHKDSNIQNATSDENTIIVTNENKTYVIGRNEGQTSENNHNPHADPVIDLSIKIDQGIIYQSQISKEIKSHDINHAIEVPIARDDYSSKIEEVNQKESILNKQEKLTSTNESLEQKSTLTNQSLPNSVKKLKQEDSMPDCKKTRLKEVLSFDKPCPEKANLIEEKPDTSISCLVILEDGVSLEDANNEDALTTLAEEKIQFKDKPKVKLNKKESFIKEEDLDFRTSNSKDGIDSVDANVDEEVSAAQDLLTQYALASDQNYETSNEDNAIKDDSSQDDSSQDDDDDEDDDDGLYDDIPEGNLIEEEVMLQESEASSENQNRDTVKFHSKEMRGREEKYSEIEPDSMEEDIDMDDLVIHDEVTGDADSEGLLVEDRERESPGTQPDEVEFEEPVVPDSEVSRSESPMDMSDMIIQDESEEAQSESEEPTQPTKEVRTKDVNLNHEAIIQEDELVPHEPVQEFTEQEINAADQEASDILLNMASEFFTTDSASFGTASEHTDNTNSRDPENEWTGDNPTKNDVLANLLMNAGVYTEGENSNPLL